MQRFYETIVDTLTGAALQDAEVWVFNAADGSIATLYMDEGGLATVANPLITDQNGYIEFFAADGKYDLDVRAGSQQRVITDLSIFDLADMRADLDALIGHNHDDRYYTEAEIDALFAAGVPDGDKGDITVAANVWTIDSNVLSAFGRTLIDDADAAAARTTLGIDALFAALECTDSQGWTGAATDKFISPRRLFTLAAPVAVAYGATVTLDFNTGLNWAIGTLTGPVTIANPSNMKVGQSGIIYVKQDGTGGRVASYGNKWFFPGGQATGGVLSTGANAVDAINYFVYDANTILATVAKAFAV